MCIYAMRHEHSFSSVTALTILPAVRIAGLTAARSANPIQAQTQARTSDYLLRRYA